MFYLFVIVPIVLTSDIRVSNVFTILLVYSWLHFTCRSDVLGVFLWQLLRSLYLNPFCFRLIYFFSHAVTTGACHSQWTKTHDHLLYILDLSCFCDSQLTYIPQDLFLFCLCSLGQLWCRILLSFEHCPRKRGVTLVRHSKAPVGWAQISKGSKDRVVWQSTYNSTTSISHFEVIQLNEHQF
jgi:hypothetical protein